MEIVCGKDIIDIAEVSDCYVGRLFEKDLEKAERQINGKKHSLDDLETALHEQVDLSLLNKYAKEISWALFQVGPYSGSEDKWEYSCDFSKDICFTTDSDTIFKKYHIVWRYYVDAKQVKGYWDETRKERLCADPLVRALKFLLDKAASKVTAGQKAGKVVRWIAAVTLLQPDLYPDDGYHIDPDAEQEIDRVYKQLLAAKVAEDIQQDRISKRDVLYWDFMRDHKYANGLVIKYNDTYGYSRVYVDNICGFNLDEKAEEIRKAIEAHRKHQEKQRNSDNQGEADVEYALKWILAANKGIFVPIIGDCESNRRINCIWLKNPAFINEPQEFDHLLVCAAGIISIETKNWKDRIEIREDGKWIRYSDNAEFGVESPKAQVQRHEALLKSILPDVPVFSLLCFSHASVVVDGKENFDACPIITKDNLGDAIQAICSAAVYTEEEVSQIVAKIESYKVGNKK